MAANPVTDLIPPKAPRLPAGPVEYDQRFIDSFTSILRQYFNQVDNTIGQLIVAALNTESPLSADWALQVARGKVSGVTQVNVFGNSQLVGSTAYGPLWEGLTPSGGYYVYPSSAVQMSLVSSSASDTSSVTVLVSGLDTNWALQSETIAMNGTTPVTTVKSYLRINNLDIQTGTNVGAITMSNGGTTYAKILAGYGQSQMSIYSVPAGYTFYYTYFQADANVSTVSSGWMNAGEYNVDNNVSPKSSTLLSQSTFIQKLDIPLTSPISHPGKTDIQYVFKASSGTNTYANCYVGGYLIATGTP